MLCCEWNIIIIIVIIIIIIIIINNAEIRVTVMNNITRALYAVSSNFKIKRNELQPVKSALRHRQLKISRLWKNKWWRIPAWRLVEDCCSY